MSLDAKFPAREVGGANLDIELALIAFDQAQFALLQQAQTLADHLAGLLEAAAGNDLLDETFEMRIQGHVHLVLHRRGPLAAPG